MTPEQRRDAADHYRRTGQKLTPAVSTAATPVVAEDDPSAGLIPRTLIDTMKQALKSDRVLYREMIRVMSNPAAVARVRLVPGTRRLQLLQTVVILVSRLMPLVAIGLLFAAEWIWAVAVVVGWFVIVNPIQTELNYELAARLVSLDQNLGQEHQP